jgi:hypothetical protein
MRPSNLGIDVHQIAGFGVLVAAVAAPGGADGFAGDRVAVGQRRHPVAGEDPRDRPRGHPRADRQQRGPALLVAPGGEHPVLVGGGGAPRAVMRPARAVLQPGPALAVVATDPAVRALPGDPELGGDVGDRALVEADTLHQQHPAMEIQTGVSVHGGRPFVARRTASDTSTQPEGPSLDQLATPWVTVTNVLAEYN